MPKSSKVLTIEEIKENMSIILSSIRSLDICEFPSWPNGANNDYFNPVHTLDIQLVIVMALFNGRLNNRINIKTHPELYVFVKMRMKIKNHRILHGKNG